MLTGSIESAVLGLTAHDRVFDFALLVLANSFDASVLGLIPKAPGLSRVAFLGEI